MRSLYWWTITAIAFCLAVPAMVLTFLAEKLGDYIDEHDDE